IRFADAAFARRNGDNAGSPLFTNGSLCTVRIPVRLRMIGIEVELMRFRLGDNRMAGFQQGNGFTEMAGLRRGWAALIAPYMVGKGAQPLGLVGHGRTSPDRKVLNCCSDAR